MGLLDTGDDPGNAGLLSFGLRLMSTPGKFGQALGTAGLGALGDMRQARAEMEQRKMREQALQMQALQLQQAQQQIAEAQALKQARASYLDSIDPSAGPARPVSVPQAMRAGLSMGDIQALMPAKAENPFAKIDPKDYTAESVRRFSQTGDFAALQPVRKVEFVEGRAMNPYATPAGTVVPARSNPASDLLIPGANGALVPNRPLIDAKSAISSAGAVKIDNSQRFENSYISDQGKTFSEMMGGINKTAFAAPAQIRKLERMEALLEGVDGGRLAPTGLEVASAANAIGIKMDPKLGNKEAAQALAREIAAGFRQPGTGPMTDKDFENFLLQVPDLSKSAEGRKQITSTMKAAASRDIQIAKMAREYERRNKRLDNGFLDEAAQYIAENPVIGAPQGWKVR